MTQTYNESNVSLVFTVDRPVSWIGYSLDGADNVTFTGNYTLSELSNGVYNVTVFASDSFGYVGASKTVSFSVASKSIPYVLVVGAVLAIVFVCIVLILLLKRHKPSNQ